MTAPKLEIWITVEGGLILNVETNQPADVNVVDLDIEGSEPDRVVPSLDGESECYFEEYPAEVMSEEQLLERENWKDSLIFSEETL